MGKIHNDRRLPGAPQPLQRSASLPHPTRRTALHGSAESPDTRVLEHDFAAMTQRVLGTPSAAYSAVVPQGLRAPCAALVVLTDPEGHGGRALLETARTHGWAACVREHGAELASKRQGYGLGRLDGLLYRGSITAHEYWTGSVVFALWRDSQVRAVPAAETLRRPGEPVAFGGGYTRWDAVETFDLTLRHERQAVLQRSYQLPEATRSVHQGHVARAARGWKGSTERFAYLVPMQRTGAFPAFGLAPFLADNLTPWRIDASAGEHLPVLPLSLFQQDVNLFHKAPLTAVPRLGVDSVRALQEQVLGDTRAAGISHGFPWSDRHMQVHADFLATGEAGFAWHDLGHLMTGSIDPPEGRRTLVRLHQELSAHGKTLPLDAMIGRFPFRRLFMARLFGLTDQANNRLGMDATACLLEKTVDIVAQALPDFIMSGNAAKMAAAQAHLFAHMPSDCVLHGAPTVAPKDREATHQALNRQLVWEHDPAILRLGEAWNHFAYAQFRHARQWLHAQGYDIEARWGTLSRCDLSELMQRGDKLGALISHSPPGPVPTLHSQGYNVGVGIMTATEMRLGSAESEPFVRPAAPASRWGRLAV